MSAPPAHTSLGVTLARLELRFALGLVLVWSVVLGAFSWAHEAAKARAPADPALREGRGTLAALRAAGRALGAPHPLEEGTKPAGLEEAFVAAGLPRPGDLGSLALAWSKGERPPGFDDPLAWRLGSPLPDLAALLEGIAARRQGRPLPEASVALFLRRPDWWRSVDARWPRPDHLAPGHAPPSEDPGEAAVWRGLLARRAAAIQDGRVFVWYGVLGSVFLGLALAGAGYRIRRELVRARSGDRSAESTTNERETA